MSFCSINISKLFLFPFCSFILTNLKSDLVWSTFFLFSFFYFFLCLNTLNTLQMRDCSHIGYACTVFIVFFFIILVGRMRVILLDCMNLSRRRILIEIKINKWKSKLITLNNYNNNFMYDNNAEANDIYWESY